MRKEEYEEIVSLNECEYCGGGLDPAGTGLDRLDSSLGYERANVVPCCGRCNMIKGGELTYKETKLLVGMLNLFRELYK